MPLSELFNINITKIDGGISRTGFGLPIIVGPNATFTERSKLYSTSDLSELADDLTNGTSDPEYKMAAAVAAVTPKPRFVRVGRIDVGDADITETLNEIKNESNDFYTVLLTTRVKATLLLAMAWVETELKILITASSEADIADVVYASDADSLAKAAMVYSRSAVIYHTKAGDGDLLATTEYPDATLAGRISPYDPGSYTAMYKTLPGITADVLSPSKKKNILDKFANLYEEFGGRNILRNGTIAQNEFIDTIIFIDWLTVRMQESIFSLISSVPKIPYTDEGIQMIGAAMEEPLKAGQDVGGISGYAEDSDGVQIGGYLIELPALEDISAADKAARVLSGVKFKAWLAGAIHTVDPINGTVIV